VLDPWIDLLTSPFIAAMTGFGFGFFERDWGAGAVSVGVVMGVTLGIGGWVSPARPVGVGEARWDSLSRANRRRVARAVARGQAVSDRRAAAAAVDVADSLAKATVTLREVAVRIGLCALLVALIVASSYRGAPVGWIVAAGLSVAYLTVIGIVQQSRRTRERARRAAEANRALLASPEGVPAGVRGVRA
jgi:hypothetical protein